MALKLYAIEAYAEFGDTTAEAIFIVGARDDREAARLVAKREAAGFYKRFKITLYDTAAVIAFERVRC